MKRFVKYMPNSFDNASRNKRELAVVNRYGCEIIVCDIDKEQCVKKIDGYTVYRRENKLSKSPLFRKFQILYNWFFKEPQYLRKQKAFCISCHDLLALFIGWLSTLFISKEKKPFLVYDSHEFEIGRHTDGKRGKVAKFLVPKLEKFLMKKCVFSIMVNDSIADEVQKIHQLNERPLVVRNIPNYWDIDKSVCKKRKQEFCQQLGLAEDTFLVMYHGAVMQGRGIETLLDSIKRSQNIALVILGNGDFEYIENLKQLTHQLKISKKVLFHSAVNIDVLWQYVGAADVGMVTIPAVSRSYYYMLPNKFFENIQSLTPIIGSDFPEIRRIVKGYDIGLLVNPESVDDIVKAIDEMRTDSKMYSRFKMNLMHAKEELCWENEQVILEAAYGKILR
jgi:glycosyltransferase involved in cell wall biosynthesis